MAAKKILTINLDTGESDIKSFKDLKAYIGGVGVGLKLLEIYRDKDPIVISTGPLNGFFPFASKTSIVLLSSGVVEDIYIGGSLSLRMKFAGLDSIVIYGKAKHKTVINILNTQVLLKNSETSIETLGLPGKRSGIKVENNKAVLDHYFTVPERFLEDKLKDKNIEGLVITGTEIYKPKDFSKYEELYHRILEKKDMLSADEGKYPSCSNCPLGCGKSKIGEIGGNVLIHSLVACEYANSIYSDIGTVFSCLNILGYDYTHEDIENLPDLVEETLKNLSA